MRALRAASLICAVQAVVGLGGLGSAHAERLETAAFGIDVPANWDTRRVDSPAAAKTANTGTWMLASPTRNSRVLLHVGATRAKDLHGQLDHFVDTHLRDHVRKLQISSFKVLEPADGLESALATFYGVAKRVQTGQVYKLVTYLARSAAGKRTVYLTVMGTKDSWGRQALRFEKLLDSLELK